MTLGRHAYRNMTLSAHTLRKMTPRRFYAKKTCTIEQAVKACMYNVSTLRKIVTKFRRDLNNMSVDEFLRIHATIGLATNTIGLKKNKPFNERIGTYKEYLAKGPRQGGYSMKEKRDMVRRLKKKFHSKPVSKMNRENLVRMIYGTAYDLSINWVPYFEGMPQARRIPKSCAKAIGPGSVQHTEANVLPSKGPKRAPNFYAKFVREITCSACPRSTALDVSVRAI